MLNGFECLSAVLAGEFFVVCSGTDNFAEDCAVVSVAEEDSSERLSGVAGRRQTADYDGYVGGWWIEAFVTHLIGEDGRTGSGGEALENIGAFAFAALAGQTGNAEVKGDIAGDGIARCSADTGIVSPASIRQPMIEPVCGDAGHQKCACGKAEVDRR